jgi:hypothetical protein
VVQNKIHSPLAELSQKEVEAGRRRAEELTRQVLEGVLALRPVFEEYNALVSRCENLMSRYYLHGPKLATHPYSRYMEAAGRLISTYERLLDLDAGLSIKTRLAEEYQSRFKTSKSK